jgi:polyvinyl alcohol dehydrogenase (cytochrome)
MKKHHIDNGNISRRRLALATGAAALFHCLPSFTMAQATPVLSDAPGWPLYGHDATGTKASGNAGISSENVSQLVPRWQFEVAGAVSSTPVIADGVTYVGSYDGNLYAIDLESGESVWTYATGAAIPEPNLQIDLGITGSAAIVDGVAYVGDAAAVVHAIDAETGESLWSTRVDEQPNASIWSSPVVVGGILYIGVASVAKQTGFRGSVVALDAESGQIVWQTYVVPEGADGAGVFAVPVIDTARNLLIVGTQNAYTANPAPFGDPISILALDLSTGERVWSFAAPVGDGTTAPTDDVGFSASPNLFSAEIDGEMVDLVGNGQKSGDYWVLNRDTGAEVWRTTVSPPGFLGGMEGTSAVADGVIAVPATDWPEFDGPATGLVTALDAATGETLWSTEHDGPAASPAAISSDVVFSAGLDGVLHAYSLTDGTELWNHDLGASVSGGIAVAAGAVVLGAATPQFAPFILPGTKIVCFGIPEDATPPSATPVS